MLPKMPKIPLPNIPIPKISTVKAPKSVSQDFEVAVVMMGGRRCGKTSVLASMQKCFDENFNGQSPLVITSADEHTLGTIEKKKHELVGYFNKRGRWFKPDVEPTREITPYGFTVGLRGKSSRICVRFVDFPGEWLSETVNADDLQSLKNELEKSKIVLIAIDTPHLMECDGDYNELCNRCYRTTELLKTCGFGDKGPGLLLFVPLKCEKYVMEGKMGEVIDKVQDAYKVAIKYVGGGDRSEYLTAITPIVTLGGASFSHFDFDNGEIKLNTTGIPETAIYKFSGAERYEPKDCDLPLLFVLAYTLAMAQRAKEKKRIPGPAGLIVDWFQESILNWPSADDYLQEYDSILTRLNEAKARGTVELLNKATWIKL